MLQTLLVHFFYILIGNHIGKPMKDRYYKNFISYILILSQFTITVAQIFTKDAYFDFAKLVDLKDDTLRLQIFLISNGFGLANI